MVTREREGNLKLLKRPERMRCTELREGPSSFFHSHKMEGHFHTL